MITYIIKVDYVCSDYSVSLDMTRNGDKVASQVYFDTDDAIACDSDEAKEIIYALFRCTENPIEAIKFLIKNPKAQLHLEVDE